MNKNPLHLHKKPLLILTVILSLLSASCAHSVRGGASGIASPSTRHVCLQRQEFEMISLALKKCRRLKDGCEDRIRDAAERERVILGAELAKCQVDKKRLEARKCNKCQVVWPWIIVGVGVGIAVGVGVGIAVFR